MALTITIDEDEKTVVGNKAWVCGTIAFDTSYPTGGEDLTPANLGLSKVNHISFTSDVVNLYWNRSTEKLLAYYGDNDNVADAEFAQVANADNISAANVEFVAWGVRG